MAANSNTIVLVTGGNGGIGFEICKLLASQPGYHVIMGSRSLNKGEQALSSIQEHKPAGSIRVLQLDVTSDDSIAAAVKDVESQSGRLDVLCNNAGIITQKPDTRTNFREDYETNAISPVLMTQAFAPLLRKSQDPRLVYISSGLGSITGQATPGNPMREADYLSYRMTKAALNMAVANAGWKYEKDGFKCFAYCPGYVVSDLAGMREEKIKSGAATPEGSAQGVLRIVKGERDADMGKFLHTDGVYGW